MNKYIVKNCPARDDIYKWIDTGPENLFNDANYQLYKPNWCLKQKKTCEEITDCELKKMLDFCSKRAAIGGIDATAEKIIEMWQIDEVQDARQV